MMAATIRDLDRLVSKTELTPVTKTALRGVRRAILTGLASDPEEGEAEWRIGITSRGGNAMRFHFSFKKVTNDRPS